LAYATVAVFAVQGTYLIGEVKVICAKAAFVDYAGAAAAQKAVNAMYFSLYFMVFP
tara:strand:+ start:108 stop:275 length:168 start_codon:yes stop_codon:yes gene_type:complete